MIVAAVSKRTSLGTLLPGLQDREVAQARSHWEQIRPRV